MEPNEPTASAGPSQPPQGQQAQAGLDPSVGGLLAYLLGWIGGLIMMLTQQHPEVRFHGLQSILYNVAAAVLWIAVMVLSGIVGLVPGLGFLSGLISLALFPVVGLGLFGVWIFLVIKGYQLEHFKLPVIGDLSEQWSGYHS